MDLIRPEASKEAAIEESLKFLSVSPIFFRSSNFFLSVDSINSNFSSSGHYMVSVQQSTGLELWATD